MVKSEEIGAPPKCCKNKPIEIPGLLYHVQFVKYWLNKKLELSFYFPPQQSDKSVQRSYSCLKIKRCDFEQNKTSILQELVYFMKATEITVFPHIVSAATILFWKLECGKYSREETIQGRKLLIYWFFVTIHTYCYNGKKGKSIDIPYFMQLGSSKLNFCLLQLENLAQIRAPFCNLSL